ncbi:MAG: hypothetical protein ABR973_09055 [Candidatus Acidiferrales bacterium]|jgi:hypothetical protein
MARRNALVVVALVDKVVDTLSPALGFGRIVVRNIRYQLPDEKFLKDIGGGSCANPD